MPGQHSAYGVLSLAQPQRPQWMHPLGPCSRRDSACRSVRPRGARTAWSDDSWPSGQQPLQHVPARPLPLRIGYKSSWFIDLGPLRSISTSAPNHQAKRCKPPPPVTRRSGQSGPKSGACLKLMVLAHGIKPTGGVRVVPGAVSGTGPVALTGKTRGEAQASATAWNIPRHHKRAFNRARHRAANSALGGTWYRGQWHDTHTLGALSVTPAKTRQPSRPTHVRPHAHVPLQVFSWNAGGLNAGVFQELVAWLDEQAMYQVAIVQETHWHHMGDFHSGSWQCVHTSGHDQDQPDRSSGVFVMLERKAFRDVSVQELCPGRVLHVQATYTKTGLPITMLAVYQHVWRSHLSTEVNRQLRGVVWGSLRNVLQCVPVRHHVLVAGDLNSSLSPAHPHVGYASSSASCPNHCDELQQLLEDCQLTALNTWHAADSYTYQCADVTSQIDFILTRVSTSGGSAKWSCPIGGFPVAGWRQAGHRPLRATLCLRPYRPLAPQTTGAARACNVAALQQAVASHTAQADALRHTVELRLQELRPTDAQQAQTQINQVLLAAAQEHFPATRSVDDRVSADPSYRASAKATWDLYARLKLPCHPILPTVWQKWRLAVQFRRASKALRDQSRAIKRAKYLQQVDLAEQAAAAGDQRTLFQIVKRLAPKSFRGASRLLGPDGRLLSAAQELTAVLTYSHQTFACIPDDTQLRSTEQSLCIRDEDLQRELGGLGVCKAVPAHTAPGAVWKLCSASISAVLGPVLREHFSAPAQERLEGDWKDCYIKWLPKPNKKPLSVADLRPIGLQCPSSKALAGVLKGHLLEALLPRLRWVPQFAYTKNRGTADAILRVHAHFDRVAHALRDNVVDRFQRRQGRRAGRCVGGCSLSLDLSKAFDSVCRPTMYQSLLDHGVRTEVINAVQQLHQSAAYRFEVGDHHGAACTSNGIKQGCKIAPYLWCFFMLEFTERLQKQRTPDWVLQVMTLFADDVWSNWLIRQEEDFLQAKKDIELILTELEAMRLQINYKKTAILLRLVGRDASRVLKQHTSQQAGQTHLHLTVSDRHCTIPIKVQHEYLGTTVSYQNRIAGNTSKRRQAGQLRYQAIRRTLLGRHTLSTRHRLSLWTSCISSSLMYSIPFVGCHPRSLMSLDRTILRHLRAILRKPAHKSRVPNSDIWTESQVTRPHIQALRQLQAHLDKLCHRLSTSCQHAAAGFSAAG